MAVSPSDQVIRFGVFELNLKAAQLSRSGTQLRLPQQPIRLLALLLERPGEIITRDELRQRLWPSDVFVDFDHGLNKSIQKIRDALGDSATSPRYVETIPRVGYRFIAPLRCETLVHETVIQETPVRQPGESIAVMPQQPGDAPPTKQATGQVPLTGKKIAKLWWAAAAMAAFCILLGLAGYLALRPHPAVLRYAQLTDFTDAAAAPALSPDGRMLAFIRGNSSFFSADQIYVKMLPRGEARRLTNDGDVKTSLSFSPDGSQIAYTIMDPPLFSTYTVSIFGGPPKLLLRNAAGLSWLDAQHYLFSRTRSGVHLGVVTASVTGGEDRELYYPPHERGMVHASSASPDHTMALAVEMGSQGTWVRCKLFSMVGEARARPVGPDGPCTAAGWSPDGQWMYFIATTDGPSHLWRQRFPDGRPEQLTSGPSEEDGLAVGPDARSVVTSIGVHQSAIWIHDEHGERSLSSEGEIVSGYSPPRFDRDEKTLYYLLSHQGAGAELWRMNVQSGESEAVLPGVSMIAFDVSPDSKQVVYAANARDEQPQLWLAPMDKSAPPRPIGSPGKNMPHFGPRGKILFMATEGNVNYLEAMNPEGKDQEKVLSTPILEIQAISPERRWVVAIAAERAGKTAEPRVVAIPAEGGPPRRLCTGYCLAAWAPNGKYLFLPVEAASQTASGRSMVVAVGPNEELPPFPASGVSWQSTVKDMPGAQWVNREDLVPGRDPNHYVYVKTISHRNLYQVSMP